MARNDCQSPGDQPWSSENYCGPVCLTTGQVVGLSFATQAGFISATAVLVLLGIIARRYWQYVRHPPPFEWRLIRTNMDAYMLNLLFADLLMSLGAILDVKWADERKVYCGSYCNAQGAIQLIGETAVSLFTFAITLHSFVSVFGGKAIKYRPWLWGGVTASVWLFVLLWAVIGYATHLQGSNDSFYAPTPFWCWISPKYTAQRLAGEYVWLWFAGFGNILLYIPLFFVMRGNIVWDPALGWQSARWAWLRSRSSHHFSSSLAKSRDTMSTMSSQEYHGVSVLFLLYPLAYTVVVLPVSVVRWITFHDKGMPDSTASTATAIAVSIFNLSGLVNVVLLLYTRTNVLLLGFAGVGSDSELSNDRDSLETQELERYTGVSRTSSRRRRIRDSTENRLPDIGSTPNSPVADTGFGGPIVRLRFDDSDSENGAPASAGPSGTNGRREEARGNNMNLSARAGATGAVGSSASSALHGQNLMPEILRSETRSPGREYLESLGARPAVQAAE